MKNLILLAMLLIVRSPGLADNYYIPAAGSIAQAPTPVGESKELEEYKCYMRNVLFPVWDREMRTNESSLWFGKVCISCIVHSDGSLSDLALTVGESTGLMKTVCRQSLLDSAPFKPFNAAMVKQVGNSYSDIFTFTVVRRPSGTGTGRPKDWSSGEAHDPSPPGSSD